MKPWKLNEHPIIAGLIYWLVMLFPVLLELVLIWFKHHHTL